MRDWMRFGLVAAVVTAMGSAALAAGEAPPASQLPYPWTSVSPEKPRPGDWVTIRRTYDVQAFSPLKQITKANVNQLKTVWSYSVPDTNNWMMTPIVANGIMYFVEGGNRVVALDAATGDALWIHQRQYPEDISMSQAFSRTRGVTMSGNTIYWGTPDAHLLALDAKTGDTRWDIKTGDYHNGEGHNHPGLVADGKVFMGSAGGDRTFQGKFRAYDAETGKPAWVLNTVPLEGEPGYETWPSKFPHLGAAVWGTISYDPATHTVFFGTGQPAPWATSFRGEGKALYSNSIMAVNARTGKIRWYFQTQPEENWDRDAAFEVMLVDFPYKGKLRKAIVQTSKIGWGVVLDRETGEFLHAFKVAYESVITGWTPQGEPIVDPASIPRVEDIDSAKTFLICPEIGGARNLNAGSFSKLTGLYYEGINTACMTGKTVSVTLGQGRNFSGGSGTARLAPGHDYVGELKAFDPATGKQRWGYRPQGGAAMAASVMATAGRLVFGGTVDREFFALDDTTGKPLWRTRLNGDVSGGVISYEVGGRQYVAVTAGGHSIASVRYAPLTNVRLPEGSGAVWVFALPGKAGVPEPVIRAHRAPVRMTYSVGPQTPIVPMAGATVATGAAMGTSSQAIRGMGVFRTSCGSCHTITSISGKGFRAKWSSGSVADLFHMVASSMPQNAPGSLPKSDYAAVIAYLLQESGYPTGPSELPAEEAALKAIPMQ